jgi:hypothetical protein
MFESLGKVFSGYSMPNNSILPSSRRLGLIRDLIWYSIWFSTSFYSRTFFVILGFEQV